VGDIDACRQAIDNAIRKADEAADYRTAMKAVGEAIDAATRLDAALLRSGVSFDDMSDQTESDHKRTSEASLRVQRKFL
jgi:diketogulonate reductase-like aldo/keto reductase